MTARKKTFYIVEYEKAWEIVGIDLNPGGLVSKLKELDFEIPKELNNISSYLYVGHFFHKNKEDFIRDKSRYFTTFIVDNEFQHEGTMYKLKEVRQYISELVEYHLNLKKYSPICILNRRFTNQIKKIYEDKGFNVEIISLKKSVNQ